MTTRRRPEVVAFDVNETLLDLAPVRAALIEAGEPETLLPTVFARTLLTGFAAAAVGSWCALPRRLRRGPGAGERPRPRPSGPPVLDGFGELAPHPDVEPALRRLVEAGIRVVTLSHGSPGVAEAGLERGGITPLVERSLSSEAIRAWKPSARSTCGPPAAAASPRTGWRWSPRTAGTCSARSGPGSPAPGSRAASAATRPSTSRRT